MLLGERVVCVLVCVSVPRLDVRWRMGLPLRRDLWPSHAHAPVHVHAAPCHAFLPCLACCCCAVLSCVVLYCTVQWLPGR